MQKDFAAKVLDRFRNPHIDHQWLSITMQYSSKMKLRNIPVIEKYLERFGVAPEYMAAGMAAHILFMIGVQGVDGYYFVPIFIRMFRCWLPHDGSCIAYQYINSCMFCFYLIDKGI